MVFRNRFCQNFPVDLIQYPDKFWRLA